MRLHLVTFRSPSFSTMNNHILSYSVFSSSTHLAFCYLDFRFRMRCQLIENATNHCFDKILWLSHARCSIAITYYLSFTWCEITCYAWQKVSTKALPQSEHLLSVKVHINIGMFNALIVDFSWHLWLLMHVRASWPKGWVKFNVQDVGGSL